MLLQAEMFVTAIEATLQAEQETGAVPAVLLVSVQVPPAENVAVKLSTAPFELMVTPVKVCEVLLPKLPTATLAVPLPVRFSVPLAGALAKVTVTLAVNVSSPVAAVFWLLQALMFVTEMAVTLQAVPEQLAGAVPALEFVKVQEVALKLAVRLMAVPSALIVTPVNAWLVPVLTAALAVPSPLRLRVPLAGGLAYVTVTVAVKVSSAVLGVPWLLQALMFDTAMALMAQAEQEAGAVPAVAFVKVQAVAEKLAVRLIAPPFAGIVTPVKVWVVAPMPLTATLALPDPESTRLPVVGRLAKVTVTLAV